MHPTFFRIKRAHHSSLRVSREILAVGRLEPLTPARFDLLHVVYKSADRFVPQKDLTRMLGLHPSTVSKMLTRLEELGLAVRELNWEDCRERDVFLTPLGRALMERATAQVFGDGHAALVVESAIAPLRWGSPRGSLRAVRRTNGTLRRYALALRDTAVPLYAPLAAYAA